MTTARDRILEAAEELIADGDVPPSLDAVAARAGVSKGGLLYHFGKHSLLEALVERAIEVADGQLQRAAAEGRMAAEWLSISVPGAEQLRVFRGLSTMLKLTSAGEVAPSDQVKAAVQRWQQMLEQELGDPVRASLVRLVGDGLLLNTLFGRPPTSAEVDALAARLGVTGPARG